MTSFPTIKSLESKPPVGALCIWKSVGSERFPYVPRMACTTFGAFGAFGVSKSEWP